MRSSLLPVKRILAEFGVDRSSLTKSFFVNKPILPAAAPIAYECCHLNKYFKQIIRQIRVLQVNVEMVVHTSDFKQKLLMLNHKIKSERIFELDRKMVVQSIGMNAMK